MRSSSATELVRRARDDVAAGARRRARGRRSPRDPGFQTHEQTAEFAFIRFHHGTHGRRGNYCEASSSEWARAIAEWAAERDVYAYFNNDWEGFAPRNAEALAAMLRA